MNVSPFDSERQFVLERVQKSTARGNLRLGELVESIQAYAMRVHGYQLSRTSIEAHIQAFVNEGAIEKHQLPATYHVSKKPPTRHIQLDLHINGGGKEVDDLLSLLYDHLGGYEQLDHFTHKEVK